MKPDISEFSYGYALTSELVGWHHLPITAAPIFPSLIEEGKPGGGYDLKLQMPGVALLLQFKLSDYMVKGTAAERKLGLFSGAFFRMHLRPGMHSAQHQMLLDQDHSGALVWYVAPAFSAPAELNDLYFHRRVAEQSAWFRPSTIGPLPDPNPHHVSFTLGGDAYRLSEPQKLEARHSHRDLINELMKATLEADAQATVADSLKRMYELLREYRFKYIPKSGATARTGRDPESPTDLAIRLAEDCRVYLGAQLFIVQRRKDDT